MIWRVEKKARKYLLKAYQSKEYISIDELQANSINDYFMLSGRVCRGVEELKDWIKHLELVEAQEGITLIR